MGSLDLQLIAKLYLSLCEKVPLKPINSQKEYATAIACLNELLDAGGADEKNQLAGLVYALGEFIEDYEKRHFRMPHASPKDTLSYLMRQHGLKQIDLADFASQGTISEVLSGKRAVSKNLARKLAKKFGVSAAAFL